MRFFVMHKGLRHRTVVNGDQIKCEVMDGLGDHSVTEQSNVNDPKQIKESISGFAAQIAITTLMDHLGVDHETACEMFWRGEKTRPREMLKSLRVGMGSSIMMLKDHKTGENVMSLSTVEELIERSV